MSDKDNGDFVGHFSCIADELPNKKSCSSSDGLAIYQHKGDKDIHYDGFCWSCNQFFTSDDVHRSSISGELGIENGVVTDSKKVSVKPKKEAMTTEQVIAFIKSVGYQSGNYRGIPDEYSQFYGHLTKVDNQGKVLARFYPETEEDKVVGYKSRVHPKSFGKLNQGRTGIKSQLSGQVKFKAGGKYLLIVGGEEDKAAAFGMLRESQKKRGQQEFEPIAVVSPTTGEGSAAKQIAAQYDFCNGFDNIIIAMDNDSKGHEATAEIVKVLPAEKVKIATWSGKDPNKMYQDGKQDQFVRDFYNAKPYLADGVITSVEADESIEEELARPKIKLPEFMRVLQNKMAGGIPLGYWVNWIAMTGVGKSTTVNEAIREWVYNSPYKVGILSLELTDAQYMIAMLSREVGAKINLIENPEEAVAFVQQPEVQLARTHLRENDFGEERFVILDDREGSLEHTKKQIEKLIKKHGCQLIVIDPINDLFDGVGYEEQAAFIKWMKAIVKTGVTFSCVCHVRKSNNSTDKNGKRIVRELTEDDVSGLSLITKSAGANIFLNRDKYAEDVIEQNTTKVTMGKCRWTGITGNAGSWFYDNKTHTMYDFDTYFSKESEGIPVEYSSYEEQEIDIADIL
jgi:hypothetical protein